jgi:hypothetical protein
VQSRVSYLSIAVEFENGQDLTYYWSAALPEETAYRCPLPWWDRHETHIAMRSGSAGLGTCDEPPSNVPIALITLACSERRQTNRSSTNRPRRRWTASITFLPRIASAMSSASSPISASFMPKRVISGTPTRRPEGFRGS